MSLNKVKHFAADKRFNDTISLNYQENLIEQQTPTNLKILVTKTIFRKRQITMKWSYNNGEWI